MLRGLQHPFDGIAGLAQDGSREVLVGIHRFLVDEVHVPEPSDGRNRFFQAVDQRRQMIAMVHLDLEDRHARFFEPLDPLLNHRRAFSRIPHSNNHPAIQRDIVIRHQRDAFLVFAPTLLEILLHP